METLRFGWNRGRMGTRIEETNTSGEILTISKAEQHSFFILFFYLYFIYFGIGVERGEEVKLGGGFAESFALLC